MLLFLRKVLFYLLAVLYLFVVPYTILYALGYIFNPTEAALVKTGLVSITTFPGRATVFVQGKKFSERTPTAVRDLLPGRYGIRISLKGFESWEKEIPIEFEKATRLEPVILLPRRFEEEGISPHAYEGMIPDILQSKIYAWQDPRLDSLRRIDLFFKKDVPIGRIVSRDAPLKMTKLHHRRGSPVALMEVEEKGQKGFLVLDPDREKKMAKGLGKLLRAEAEEVLWDSKEPDSFYFLSEGSLSRVDIRRGALYPAIASDLLGAGIRHRRLYLLRKDFSLIETDAKGENPKPALEPEKAKALEGILKELGSPHYHIEVVDPTLILFLNEDGALVANRSPYRLVEKEVVGILPAAQAEEEKILFWTHRDLGVIEWRDAYGPLLGLRAEGSAAEEPEPTLTWLTRQGRDIRQAFWAYEDSHALFLDTGTVYLVEAQGPKPFHLREIARVKFPSHVIYSDRNHSLYFLHPEDHRLVRRKLPD